MPSVKRRVQLVQEEPEARKFGKARMFGYSIGSVANRAGCSAVTVKRATKAGELRLDSMVSVENWLKLRADKKAKRGKKI
jgi:hypothetical protein